jgi:hypothetical protein
MTDSSNPPLRFHHEQWVEGRQVQARITAVHPDHGQVGAVTYLAPKQGPGPIRIQRLALQRGGRSYAEALLDQVHGHHPQATLPGAQRTAAMRPFLAEAGLDEVQQRALHRLSDLPEMIQGGDAHRLFAEHGIHLHEEDPWEAGEVDDDHLTRGDTGASVHHPADRELHTSQDYLSRSGLEHFIRHPWDGSHGDGPRDERPSTWEHEGQHWINGGHHRLLADRMTFRQGTTVSDRTARTASRHPFGHEIDSAHGQMEERTGADPGRGNSRWGMPHQSSVEGGSVRPTGDQRQEAHGACGGVGVRERTGTSQDGCAPSLPSTAVREAAASGAEGARRPQEGSRRGGWALQLQEDPLRPEGSSPQWGEPAHQLFRREGLSGVRTTTGSEVVAAQEEGRVRVAQFHDPDQRIFGPTYGLDHRLWAGEALRPAVRAFVLGQLDGFWRPVYGPGWRSWTTVVAFCGSEASGWTSPDRTGNGDFDVLLNIDHDQARAAVPRFAGQTDEQIDAALNREFQAELVPHTTGITIPVDGTDTGPWDMTFYVAKDLHQIKPYAAYDLLTGTWIATPPTLAHWSIEDFPQGHPLVQEIHAVATEVRAVLKMPEPYRTQQGDRLWHYIHDGRSQAFSDQGEGWYDTANLLEKACDQLGLWEPLVQIHFAAHADPHLLDAPADWSNDPRQLV